MSENNGTPRDNRSEYQQDHVMEHTYDGIQEFDNKLPNWWLWIMWGSMVFALFYWLVFHTLEIRPLPVADFEAEMQVAADAQLARMLKAGLDDNTFVLLSENPDKVAEGKELFATHCVACHLADASGSVGPNLTDNTWIHGCSPMDMHKTVSNGVAAKGMPPWMNQLGPTRVMNVVTYVFTLRNSNLPGKAPEGDPCSF